MSTVIELKRECKEKGLSNYSTLRKAELLVLLASVPRYITRSVTRNAGLLKKTEEKNVMDIVNAIKNDTESGRTFKNDFFTKFNKRIIDVRTSGGKRRDHYDFDINIEGDGWKHVEHKGSVVYSKIKEDYPWKTGIQFFNGPADKFSLGKSYAEKFYNTYIGSGDVSKRYNIKTHIPSYNDWIKDVFNQGKGKSKFILELRDKCVKGLPANEQGLHKERDEFTRIFNKGITGEDKKTLIKEVLASANSVLTQKDYWLEVHGDINTKFYSKWSDKFTIEHIEEVIVVDSVDCTYKCVCKNNIVIFAKLRWGYNKGISNLRIDLK